MHGDGDPGRAAAIRRAEPCDFPLVQRLVEEVAAEKFGYLFEQMPPVSDGPESWCGAWVADLGGAIVGAGLAAGDRINDLWVRAPDRGQGIGAALLKAMEEQIVGEGHRTGRLRVVAENEGALRFYRRHGWEIALRGPHERWGFEMIGMIKQLRP